MIRGLSRPTFPFGFRTQKSKRAFLHQSVDLAVVRQILGAPTATVMGNHKRVAKILMNPRALGKLALAFHRQWYLATLP